MSYMDEEAEAALVVATEAEAEAAEDVPWPLLDGSCKFPSEWRPFRP